MYLSSNKILSDAFLLIRLVFAILSSRWLDLTQKLTFLSDVCKLYFVNIKTRTALRFNNFVLYFVRVIFKINLFVFAWMYSPPCK